MAYEITRINDEVLYVRISGVMKLLDQHSLQAASMELLGEGRKVRLLVTLIEFKGWEKGVDWSDVGFLMAHADDIAKMAIVGDERWKDLVFAFVGKGFRTTDIKFFDSSSQKEAETWIHT